MHSPRRVARARRRVRLQAPTFADAGSFSMACKARARRVVAVRRTRAVRRKMAAVSKPQAIWLCACSSAGHSPLSGADQRRHPAQDWLPPGCRARVLLRGVPSRSRQGTAAAKWTRRAAPPAHTASQERANSRIIAHEQNNSREASQEPGSRRRSQLAAGLLPSAPRLRAC